MKALRQKLLELKKFREIIKREDDMEKRTISQMESEIQTLEMSLAKKNTQIQENEAKLERYDEMIGHSQATLEKLTENTKKLEDVIEGELASLKGQMQA